MAIALPVIDGMDSQVLANVLNSRVEEESVNINAHVNEDWLKTTLDGIASYVVTKLSNPSNIVEERKYLKIARLFVESLAEYSNNMSPNYEVANDMLQALKVFLSLLEEKVNGNIVGKHGFTENN